MSNNDDSATNSVVDLLTGTLGQFKRDFTLKSICTNKALHFVLLSQRTHVKCINTFMSGYRPKQLQRQKFGFIFVQERICSFPKVENKHSVQFLIRILRSVSFFRRGSLGMIILDSIMDNN